MAGAQVTRLDWCEELAAGVKRAIARDFEAVAANVINGYAQGWRIKTDSGRCYVITRIDEFNGRRECVAMAVAGRGALDACALIYNAAIAAGCDRIRFHTENPAVARLVGKRYAVRLDESVFSVAVGDRA